MLSVFDLLDLSKNILAERIMCSFWSWTGTDRRGAGGLCVKSEALILLLILFYKINKKKMVILPVNDYP